MPETNSLLMNSHRTPAEVGQLWFSEIWNQRNAPKAFELMTEDATGYLEGGQTITGPAAFLEFQNQFLSAVPDLKIDVVESVSDDSNVCVHWVASGNHTGDGMGFVPSGQPISFRGVTWFKVRDGKAVEGRDFWNINALMAILAGGT